MEKEEARKQVIHLWRSLPVMSRQELSDAIAYAAAIKSQMSFHTMGDQGAIIQSWLIRDLMQGRAAAQDFEATALLQRRNSSQG